VGTVLVPLDGSPLAEAALPLASLLADTLEAKLDLLRVVAHGGPEEQAAVDYLASFHLQGAAIHVRQGAAAEGIVQHARSEHASLVVMTTHARSGLERAVLGSVTAEVIARSPSPTVVLRGRSSDPRLRSLLVAIGGMSAAPLSSVTELARRAGARVCLLRVVTAEETMVWQRQWQWAGGPALEEPDAVIEARQQLTDLAAGVSAAGIEVDTRVLVGPVVPIIDAVADQISADLIVMTTHARLGVARAMQGSFADAVVHSTLRPVLLCRLVPMPPEQARALDVLHALQHRQAPLVPQSMVEPQYKNIGLSRTWRTRGR
jgi:nucleotide-binding universal stress UspA family protein